MQFIYLFISYFFSVVFGKRIDLSIDTSTLNYVAEDGSFKGNAIPGYVLFRIDPEWSIPEFLLLLSPYNSNWWVTPTGSEPVSSDIARSTALKALKEQTGVKDNDIIVYPDFVECLHYVFLNLSRPEYVYYLAQLKKPNKRIKLSKNHNKSKWYGFQEARKKSRWPYDTDAILAAENYFKITTPPELPSYTTASPDESVELV